MTHAWIIRICVIHDIWTDNKYKQNKNNNNNSAAEDRERIIKTEDQIIEIVQEFTYLGAIIAKDDDTSKDMDNRINKAPKNNGMLHNIWQNPHMSRIKKIQYMHK